MPGEMTQEEREGRLGRIRRHHADAPCGPNGSDECFLLSEVERLKTELETSDRDHRWWHDNAMANQALWLKANAQVDHLREALKQVLSDHPTACCCSSCLDALDAALAATEEPKP